VQDFVRYVPGKRGRDRDAVVIGKRVDDHARDAAERNADRGCAVAGMNLGYVLWLLYGTAESKNRERGQSDLLS
jgi:hypothetical protein